MIKWNVIFSVGLVFLAVACSTTINPEDYSRIRQKGAEVTKQAQATLLTNVARAMQNGGPQNAVAFCNLNASSLIDSLNRVQQCKITRISNKNRNPQNAAKNNTDKKILAVFETGAATDTVIQSGKHLVYYKTIRVGMPACLKCHGQSETDIAPATLAKLQTLYPNDLATGYRLNDFRGAWKVVFESEK